MIGRQRPGIPDTSCNGTLHGTWYIYIVKDTMVLTISTDGVETAVTITDSSPFRDRPRMYILYNLTTRLNGNPLTPKSD